jgi:hypothetical protein
MLEQSDGGEAADARVALVEGGRPVETYRAVALDEALALL